MTEWPESNFFNCFLFFVSFFIVFLDNLISFDHTGGCGPHNCSSQRALNFSFILFLFTPPSFPSLSSSATKHKRKMFIRTQLLRKIFSENSLGGFFPSAIARWLWWWCCWWCWWANCRLTFTNRYQNTNHDLFFFFFFFFCLFVDQLHSCLPHFFD